MDRQVTPEERAEVIARDVPSPIRLAAFMGPKFEAFVRTETALAHMLELGLIPLALFEELQRHRLSFRHYAPLASAPDVIKTVSESHNPTAILSMISQTVGAKRLGDELVPIRREDVAGMDARTLEELIREPLVKRRLDWSTGVAIVRKLAKEGAEAGRLDTEDVRRLREAVGEFERLLKRLGVD